MEDLRLSALDLGDDGGLELAYDPRPFDCWKPSWLNKRRHYVSETDGHRRRQAKA